MNSSYATKGTEGEGRNGGAGSGLVKAGGGHLEERFPRPYRRWVWVLLWVGLVLVASSRLGASDGTAYWLRELFVIFRPDWKESQLTEWNFWIRKSAHVGQFFVLGWLIWRAAERGPAWPGSEWSLAGAVIIGCLGMALVSEGIQLFSIYRGASLGDVLLNGAGAVLGVGLAWGRYRWGRRRGVAGRGASFARRQAGRKVRTARRPDLY